MSFEGGDGDIVKITIEIDDVHLAALDAMSDRYSVGRNQMVALLVTAAVKREEAAAEVFGITPV